MNYIQYKELELPIKIDFAVIKAVCSKLDLKLSQFESIVDNPASTEVLLFEALKRGHKLDSKELNINAQDCEEILSESYGDFLKIFTESVLKMFTVKEKKS